MLTVCYHYVRPTSPPYHRLWYLPLDQWRRQLDWLEAEHGWADKADAMAYFAGEGPEPDGAVLTFDDCLSDHHTHVLPELVQRGLWGVFFCQTGQWGRGEALPVHRRHATGGGLGTPEQEAALSGWCMTPWQVCQLTDMGMEVGGHGVTHTPLTDAGRSLRTEVLHSLGERLFCYPHGAHDPAVRECVAQKYEAAFTLGEPDRGPLQRSRVDCRHLPHGESRRA